MRVLKNYFLIITLAILLLPIFLLTQKSELHSAQAFGAMELSYAECIDFHGNTVSYDLENTDYARGITLYYEVYSPWYIIEEFNKAGRLIASTTAIETIDNTAEYQVINDGELIVYCYAADEYGNKLESVDTQIKSDNSTPQQATINQMTQWQRHDVDYRVNISFGQDNGNSGVKKADISVIYDDEDTNSWTIESPIVNDSFSINKACDIVVTVYDNAGNSITTSTRFDKFDSIKPTPPVFNKTSNVEVGENTNGYAASYDVTISYGEDEHSGIKQGSMVYVINGEQFNYNGGFVVNQQKNYYLSAYYQDNAGNSSEEAILEIKNIDRIEPSISDIVLSVNLMNENPYRITLTCIDTYSGLNRIEAEGISTTFINRIYNVYDGEFKYLDKGQIKITAYDNVGNFSSTALIVHHFGILDIEDIAVECNNKFLLLNQEEYSEKGWDKIIDLYSDLNIMLMAQETTFAEIESIASEINSAIIGDTQYTYKIINVPNHLNAQISYKIVSDDIINLKKGQRVTMVLDESGYEQNLIQEYSDEFKNKVDFESFFIAPFKLSFLNEGEEIEYDFSSGAEITMQVPRGYEARYFAVVDMQTNELLDIEVINNQITFKINGGGLYTLIIEGKQILPEIVDSISGIKIFGKTISWLAFGLTLVGVILFLALSIILLTLKNKKPTSDKE